MKAILATFAMISPLLAQELSLTNSVNSEKDMQTFESYLGTGYDQKHRPQFHFTSRRNWLNDPNGMMYYDGEYHLFLQHSPKGNLR
jgi:levanase/fructan beta-fructosidase